MEIEGFLAEVTKSDDRIVHEIHFTKIEEPVETAVGESASESSMTDDEK